MRYTATEKNARKILQRKYGITRARNEGSGYDLFSGERDFSFAKNGKSYYVIFPDFGRVKTKVYKH